MTIGIVVTAAKRQVKMAASGHSRRLPEKGCVISAGGDVTTIVDHGQVGHVSDVAKVVED